MPLIPLDVLNWFVAFGAVILEVGAVGLFVLLYLEKKNQTAVELSALVRQFGLWLGFLVSLAGFVISLYYSEVLGFVPCALCWLIRVFTYSLVVVFGVALYKGDRRHIADYIIALSVAGLLIALYQHVLQLGGTGSLPCPASGPGADCAKRIIDEFGHVTFPWVGVSAFLFLIATALHLRRDTTASKADLQ